MKTCTHCDGAILPKEFHGSFRLIYECDCSACWEDTWCAACDDECPDCGLTIAPSRVIDLKRARPDRTERRKRRRVRHITPEDEGRLREAAASIKHAIGLLAEARAKQAANAARRAYKSAEGALRHAQGVLNRPESMK